MTKNNLLNNITNFNPFEGPVIERIVHTTQSQAEIWIACMLGEDDANRAYNESISLILKGALNKTALKDAVPKLVKRHEALRSTFSPDGRFMTIFQEVPTELYYQNISEHNTTEKSNAIKEFLSNEANYVFDLVKGPLIKFSLLRLSDHEHQLIVTAHHIICDGWSFGIILEELGSFYSAHVSGNPPDIPHPETFCSYVDDELKFLDSTAFQETEKYWLDQYKDSIPTVSLPIDFSRPNLRTYTSDRFDFTLENSVVESLKKVGIKSGASLVVTLMSAFEVFLYHQTGKDDLVLGLAAAGQAFNDRAQLVGHCANILPLHSKIDPNLSFSEFLKRRKVAFFDAYEHQRFSFGQLLQKLAVPRDPSRVPLVPILFNIDYGMGSAVSFDGLEFVLKSNPRAFEAFELFLNATESDNHLILEWSYNTSLFKRDSIKQMMLTLEGILHKIIENPEITIADIVKIDESGYKNLNDTYAPYPNSSLPKLIYEQAKITPKNQALKFLDLEISYEEMQLKMNQLAHELSQKGISSGDYVGVCVPRSIELIIILGAIMQCGAAYVPLDTTYPSHRLDYMLENTGAKFLISTNELSEKLKFNATLLIMADLFSNLDSSITVPISTEVDPDTVAYTLYTSGSTGKPKGVMVTHKNLVNFLCSVKEKPGINDSDRLLSITNVSFDMSVLDLYLPLISGATLVLAHEEISKDGRLLLDLLAKERITMIQATPTTWQMLLDSGWKNPLPLKAICGAEPWSLSLAHDLLPKISELWNMYGPTETTVWSMRKQITQKDELITIGRPIANTQVYILNEHNMLIRPGEIGEIVIGGDGVSKGYLKHPELTAEKFMDNPFNNEGKSKLYRTGDLGKLLPNGELQCLGRIDHQVKIRGHRIELGEIEQILNEIDDVQSSIVVVNKDILVAFVITTGIETETSNIVNTWKEVLKDQLPSYMVPRHFYLIEEFPTTLNGKINRNALIESISISNTKLDFIEPNTESEITIAKIWQECLGIDKIDINSDFFELGGHSLLGNKAMAVLEKETGKRLPLVALLKHSTIKKLAAFMDKEFFSWNSLVPLKPTGTKDPLYIIHGENHNVLMFNELAHNLDKEQPVYGLQSKGLNGIDEPHDSIEAMAAGYISEIIASNPKGPYLIAGFSFGGIIAFEMARQLKAQGRKVRILAQFDAYVFPIYFYKNPTKKKIMSHLYLLGKIIYTIPIMFSSVKNFKWRTKLIKLQIEGLFLRLKNGKKKQYEKQFNVPYKMLINQIKAFNNYSIIPQDIIIDLFRATDDIVFVHDHKFLGWSKMARKGIRKHMVEGNHIDMFEKPHVKDFADRLQVVLDNYDSENYE